MTKSFKLDQNQDDEHGGNVATGTAVAGDIAEITPNANAFICATCRVASRVASKGLRVRVSTAGIPRTTGTIKGTLSVIQEGGGPTIAGPLTIVDWPESVNPALGTVLAVSASHDIGIQSVLPGTLCEVVWSETGIIGDGSRPGIQILSWGWYVVDDGVIE